MHELVILVNFLSIGLARESRQALLVDIDPQRLIRRNQNVDPEIKLMAVD